jgi:hypothetical protein
LFVVGKSDVALGYKRLWLVGCIRCTQVFRAAEIEIRDQSLRCECLEETYASWQKMMQGCSNPIDSVCRSWRNSFLRFVSDMGHQPPNTSLEKINENQIYEAENCRWGRISHVSSSMSDQSCWKAPNALPKDVLL